MEIGGFQKFTLIDYPERIAATIFVSGCNFACPFCHNPELVVPEKIKERPKISLEEVLDFLEERKELLEGVVVCGGEPTIYKDLPNLAKKIKEMGYLVKIDTNGYTPGILRELIDKKLVDYIAMDVKGPKKRYSKVVNKEIDVKKIEESINLFKEEKVDYEFRTTVVPNILEKKDIIEIAKWLSPAKRYFIQQFKAGETIDPIFKEAKPYSLEYLQGIKEAVSPFFEFCDVRA